MIQTTIRLTDRETGGGEPLKATIRATDTELCIDITEKISVTLSAPLAVVLAAIETEEHG